MDIEVQFKDELKCYVYCDKSIGYGIKNKFSFKKQGYQFHQNLRQAFGMVAFHYITLLPVNFMLVYYLNCLNGRKKQVM